MLEELGITKVTIPLPFRLNHVNCFLAEGQDGWLVMDTALNRPVTKEIWQSHLSDKEVKQLLITHYHPDHSGYAGELQRQTGADVLMTEISERARKRNWLDDTVETMKAYYQAVGIPHEIADGISENTIESRDFVMPEPSVDRYLNEGDLIKIGNYEYQVIFTPGHAPGLITLYNKDKNVLLSTDHILPKITPNVSYMFMGDQNPLQTFMESLQKIKQLDAGFVIPSHGEPFHGANDRIDEIVKHHEDRLNDILDQLKDGKTVYEVCQYLFGDRLTTHEMRFAIGEALAHLEFLRKKGECQREVRSHDWLYRGK